MTKYRVSYKRLDDRLYVGCRGVSLFHSELATAKFLGELEASYNIDQDSIVVHIIDDERG